MKTGIKNGWIITMDPQRTVYENGWLLIEKGRIAALGAGEPDDLVRDETIDWIDAGGSLVLPGFVNCHTHISMSLFRSLGEDMPDRLRRYMFPLEDELLDPEMVAAGARLSLLELIQGGVTTFCDMYYFEEEVAKAVQAAGVRAVLGQTILGKPAPDAPQPYGGIDRACQFVEAWRGDSLITPAFAPHAPYTCDEEHLQIINQLSESYGVPLVMHLAEMTFEVEEFARRYGKSPVQQMEAMGLLTDRLIAAHLVYVDEADIRALVRHGVGGAHNVAANAKSGRIISPAPAMHQAGLALGLGTDGPMSGNHQDIQSLLSTYTRTHKQKALDNRLCPAIEALELATIGGARALKLDHLIGSLEAGKAADLIFLDTKAPNIQPIYDPYSAIVYAAHPHNITLTMVSGRILMQDRKMKTLDQEQILEQVRKQTRRITRFARELEARARE